MLQINNLHPIITAHYQLDFLSYLSGQELQKFLAVDLPQSAHIINHAMQQTMANQAAIWGVTTKQSATILGLITLSHFATAPLTLDLNFKQAVPQEILTRLKQLINVQFHNQAVQVTPASKNATQIQQFFNH